MDLDTNTIGLTDVMNRTATLRADLMTARTSDDSAIVHASLINAVDGLLVCVRAIASELVKVELEGVDSALPS